MNWRRLPLAIVAVAILVLAAAAIPAFGRDAVAPSFDRPGSAAALAKAKRALNLARTAQRSAREAGEGSAAARAAALAAGNEAAAAKAAAQTAGNEATAAKNAASSASTGADAARATATTAREEATAAKDSATTAHEEAAAAKGAAAATQAELDATRVVSAIEPALVTSTAPIGDYEAKGGPAVEVIVPSSGLIEVWAQVEIKDDEGGAVGLYEDGAKVPGISATEFCGDDSALIDTQGGGPGDFTLFATPPTPGLMGCTSAGAPAPVLLSRPPGPHTYELRYSECSCGGEAQFRNRLLRVAPRP